jgi:hypothetical protein
MRTMTIPKESTTPRCHESFLPKNYTMNVGEDHPWLEMLVDHLLMDGLYLSTMVMVDLLTEVITDLQEAIL